MVPVMINQPEEYYRTIFESTNGLLIPGGDVSLDTHSGILKILYRNDKSLLIKYWTIVISLKSLM